MCINILYCFCLTSNMHGFDVTRERKEKREKDGHGLKQSKIDATRLDTSCRVTLETAQRVTVTADNSQYFFVLLHGSFTFLQVCNLT